jgi:hypothetical protein
MLWSGEWAWGLRARSGLEQGGDSPEGRPAPERGGDSPEGASSPRARRRFARGGVQPSSEAEIRPRGRPALERGGDFAVLRPALERGGDSPKGRRGWPLDGLAEVIWVVGSSLHQAMIMRGVIYGLWVRLCFIVLRKMGFFPGYQGTLMTVPDSKSSTC